MKQIRKNLDSNVITFYFTDESVHDRVSAVEMIVKAASRPDYIPEYIKLKDIENRSDEGNTSLQLKSDSSAEEILENLKDRNIQLLFLMGRFHETMTGIGVDLSSFEIMVTLPPARASLIDEFISMM